jgi:OmpA-OmpF porin, OOP family
MRCLAPLVIGTLLTSTASANVELGGTAGLHTFSKNGDLGVVEMGGVNQNPDGLKNSTFFGVRIGIYFNKKMGVEVEAGGIPTEPRGILFDLWMVAGRAQFVYQLRPTDDPHSLLPFIVGGASFLRIIDVGSTENESIVKKDDSDIAPYLGVGAKYRAGGSGWGVRGDLRGLLPKKDGGGVVVEVEALLSMYKDFGYKKPKKKEEPVQPPKDDDPDKDGLVGAADKCPTEPEDKDSFKDEDGCPDKDNDEDGVPDAQPDKCLNDPEDKDSFQDDDGCPDPDNDDDGVLDAADKCPTEKETKNGFKDDDGCADEIPETLKKFTGAIQGINFKVGDAALAPGSAAILDKAVAVLKEFDTVKLEIQGHTDDTPIKATPKFADNKALSQARADTVKAYFESKGIAPDRLISVGYGDEKPIYPPAGLTGAKLNDARTKNRRVEFKLVEGAAAPAPAPKAEEKK